MAIEFAAWAKLEQIEEFLSYLVEKQPLKEDTIAYIKDHYANYDNLP